MEKRLQYIVIGVVVVLAIALIFSSGPTGFSISKIGDCTDSDGGENYFEAGTTISQSQDVVYTDRCFSTHELKPNKWLKEYYCTAGRNQISSRTYLCPNGCQDGACLK